MQPRPAMVARFGLAVALLAGVLGAPAAESATPVRIAGMGVSPVRSTPLAAATDFERMRAAGLDTVMFDVWADVPTWTTSVIYPGARTSSDAELLAGITLAKSAGLRVIVVPKLWCPTCTHTWRGFISPSDPGTFFTVYKLWVNRYAELAQQAGAWAFYFGSEMHRTERYAGLWRSVASEVRARFRGPVVYDAGWDRVFELPFWDASSFISVSAYFPLSDAALPSVSELRRCWRSSCAAKYARVRWFDKLRALSRRTGKRVLFGEAGYTSTLYNTQRPYDENAGGRASQQAQANAYLALLQTFQREPWWMGAIWWEWNIAANPQVNRDYTPRDKAAESLLRRWYVLGWRGY